jgi:hypothetical protein
VDGTGSGSCPVAGFGINGVETSGSAIVVLVHQPSPRQVNLIQNAKEL